MPSETTARPPARGPVLRGHGRTGPQIVETARPRRLKLRGATAAALLAAVASGPAFAEQTLGLRIEAAYTTDDNVNRAPSDDKLRDRFFGLRVSDTQYFATSTRTRIAAQVFAGGEKFRTYNGLSHAFYGIQGELQFRTSADFSAPTYSVFARTGGDQYDSTLRDGYRHSAGVTVLKPLTDRIQLFGAAAYNVRDGKSTVFDTKDWSVQVNADYALSRGGTLYLGYEYHRGDVVSSAKPTLALLDIAEAVIQDDAFVDQGYYAYRFKADTNLVTLGYNYAFGGGQSLDLSWRWIESTPRDVPGGSSGYSGSSTYGSAPRYVANQISLAYLVRF